MRSTHLLLAAASLGSNGCFLFGSDVAFIEKDDVTIELPDRSGFRAAKAGTDEKQTVTELSQETARSVNTWVGAMVDGMATIIDALDEVPPSRRDGDARVYGPYKDDDGRDVAWLVKFEGDGDASTFSVLVGRRDAKEDAMAPLLVGNLAQADDLRQGGFTLDFDVLEAHDDLKEPGDAAKKFEGSIVVTFERDLSSEKKSIEIAFEDFAVTDFTGDETWTGDDSYRYARRADGSGTFHLSLVGQFDDNAWGGDRSNRLTLDTAWTVEGAGRSRGAILATPDQPSALPEGDLVVEECFASGGELTYRVLSEAYEAMTPGYSFGEPAVCVLAADAFDDEG